MNEWTSCTQGVKYKVAQRERTPMRVELAITSDVVFGLEMMRWLSPLLELASCARYALNDCELGTCIKTQPRLGKRTSYSDPSIVNVFPDPVYTKHIQIA